MRIDLRILAVIVMMTAAGICAWGKTDDRLPAGKDILKTIVKVNDHYLNLHSNPLLPIPYPSRNKEYEANIWTRAVYFEEIGRAHV